MSRKLSGAMARMVGALGSDHALPAFQAESNGNAVVELDPRKIRPWMFKDRTSEELRDEAYDDLKASIQKNRQEQPIKVRPLAMPADGYEYEEIYGFRRLNACLELGIPVRAIVEEMDDRTAYRLQAIENSNRTIPSAWGRALSVKKIIDSGVFTTITEIAEDTGYDRSTVSNLNRIATHMPDALRENLALHILGMDMLLAIITLCAEQPKFTAEIVKHRETINHGLMRVRGLKDLYEVWKTGLAKPAGSRKSFDLGGQRLFTLKRSSRGVVTIELSPAALAIMPDDELVATLMRVYENRIPPPEDT